MSQRAYVYYRVRAQDEAEAVAAWRALQTLWALSQPGLHGELLRRVDLGESAAAPMVTLMEVYAFDPGLGAEQRQQVHDQAAECLAPWRVGERHVERFEPCA
jgi:hypothetical protein